MIHFNHTLDLVVRYDIETEHFRSFLKTPFFSDHFLITFQFRLMDYTAVGEYQSRCLFESLASTERIPPPFSSMLYTNTESSQLNSTPTVADYLVNNVTSLVSMTLDTLAPLKKKTWLC